MVSNMHSRWSVAAAAFVLWALVAASAVYWGAKFTASPGGAGGPVMVRPPAAADPVAVARLLGSSGAVAAAAPVPSLASRFALVGVVADRSQHGAALIAVDGRPAKPFRVGTAVDESLVLQAVDARRAVLAASASGPAVLTLELPSLHK